MNRAGYTQKLLSLLPNGAAWPRETGTVLAAIAEAGAGEFSRVQQRLNALLVEDDPRRAVELLPDWEEAYGLPDPCAGTEQTVEGRRERVVQKSAMRGGQSAAYFIELAAALGYAVGITTFPVATCESECTAPLHDEPWRFAFRVDAPETTVHTMNCLSACNEALSTWGNEVLECAMRRHTHSHNHVLFGYGG